MQVTSLLSQQHQHGPECGCGHDHSHSVVHMVQVVLGIVFVLNSFIVDWFFAAGSTLYGYTYGYVAGSPSLVYTLHMSVTPIK